MEKTQEAEADNWEVKVETKALNDGSLCGYDSLHSLLSANLKPELYLFFLFFFLGLSTSALFFFFDIYESVSLIQWVSHLEWWVGLFADWVSDDDDDSWVRSG